MYQKSVSVRTVKVYFQIARYLIINKADIEAKSLNGYTPLHKAAMENHVEIAKLLVEAGCLLEEKNKWSRCQFHQHLRLALLYKILTLYVARKI